MILWSWKLDGARRQGLLMVWFGRRRAYLSALVAPASLTASNGARQGATFPPLFALLYVVINLIGDRLNAVVDPRTVAK